MSYQVLARKYRPQRFDEVVGQQGVTQTLRNAIASGRLAQAYIFAGARGVGKTTTARILAKALNCVHGPTIDPCGKCDACVEIADGRDMDVIEIDGATNTKLEETKSVIIDNLGTRPARDRFKIFIIDEVHQLSSHSFNALLKSIEEPPPHIVFMMATTELHKIPDTIRSRAQEFEFRTIGTKAITEQLRRIAETEGLKVEPGALALVARAAEGSLRDAESSFDQVIAFAGDTITTADVSAVLGLVGRDLLLEIVQTVSDEDAAHVFDLAARAVEAGQDLRLLCRELSRVVRDMMVVNIDPSRAQEPDFAPEGDIDRLTALAARFSREDLLRAFDVIARAEFEIRTSPQPRYHLEMALLRWIHLRKIQPLADVLQALGKPGATVPSVGPRRTSTDARSSATTAAGASAARTAPPPANASQPDVAAPAPASSRAVAPVATASAASMASPERVAPRAEAEAPRVPTSTAASNATPGPSATPLSPAAIRDRFVEEIRQKKKLLHGTVVAQAQRIDIEDDVVTFSFGSQHRVLKKQVDENRGVLEQIARSVSGRAMTVRAQEVEASATPAAPVTSVAAEQAQARLRERALADSAVQAMLDVFPAEIRDVEEIDK